MSSAITHMNHLPASAEAPIASTLPAGGRGFTVVSGAFARVCSIILLAMAGMICIASPGVAQNQRIGFVDTDQILSRMPEYAGIKQQLDQQVTVWQEELETLEEELKELTEEFQAREILYTEEVKEAKQNEINALQAKVNQFLQQKFSPEGDYFRIQKERLQPLQRTVFDAIRAVAEQDGYDLVFDRSQNIGLLYGDNRWDLTPRVLEELGIQEDSPDTDR
jgi:outer membrane protein